MNGLIHTISPLLRSVGLYHSLRNLRRDRRFAAKMRTELAEWRKKGCPNPPPGCIKHAVIRGYASRWGTSVLIETGTFYGDTIFALRRQFAEIHSIELAEGLHHFVKGELAHERHIHLHLGDSAVVLPQIAATLTKPALYWLDGHFCSGPSARGNKDTPVSEEVDYLLKRTPRQDVILIDDARLFDGSDGYPTLDQLRVFVAQHRPGAVFEVDADIIRIAPV
jgi:hypothetical protein